VLTNLPANYDTEEEIQEIENELLQFEEEKKVELIE